MIRSRVYAIGILSCIAGLLMSSCGGFGSLCKNTVACEGGNSNDEAACEDDLKGEEKVARDANCGAQWDAHIQCLEDHGACRGTPQNFNAGGYCDDVDHALDACITPIILDGKF
jgi:hypothetical protein